MTKKQKIGTITGSTLGSLAIISATVFPVVLNPIVLNNNIENDNTDNFTITNETSQAIYNDIVSDIPIGKISINDLNSPSNINKLKRKIASILNISVTNITNINFRNASSSNMANVTITFDENFKFNIDDNDLCFVQNRNTITSRKPFLYGLPSYHISVDIEDKFNTKITQYLESQKDSFHNGVYLDQINSYSNISSLISELNTILSQNERTIEVVNISFSVNEASTNSGVYATISFDRKIGIDESSSYIQDQNSNTLTSKEPFLVNVIEGQELTSNYLNLIDISAISKALGTYGNNVQEIVIILQVIITL